MNGIESIRESRKDGYWGAPQDDYECLEAERHVDYLLEEVDRLQVKLEQAVRMAKVVEAARDLMTEQQRVTALDERVRAGLDYETDDLSRDELWRRFGALQAALAAIDADGEGG